MITFGEGNLRIPQFAKPVYIVAGGMTDFRKEYPEKSTEELIVEAMRMAVAENDLKVSQADFRKMVNFCVYSQFADHFGDQLLAAARYHDALGFDPLGNIEVKTGGATGGSSVLAGALAVAFGVRAVIAMWYQRRARKQVRSSSTNRPGCSRAAKWPPLSNSFQWMILWNCFSAQRREAAKISFGNRLQPTGMVTLSVERRPKLSQYSRAEEAAVPGSQ